MRVFPVKKDLLQHFCGFPVLIKISNNFVSLLYETSKAVHGLLCSYIAGNDFMRVWTNLCHMECFWVTWLLAGTPFWFYPPNLEQECAEPFYVVVTGDDPSHSQGQSGKRLLLASKGHPVRRVAYQGTCFDLTHQSHTLDLTLKVSGARRIPASQLLIKGKRFAILLQILSVQCEIWNILLKYFKMRCFLIKFAFYLVELMV